MKSMIEVFGFCLFFWGGGDGGQKLSIQYMYCISYFLACVITLYLKTFFFCLASSSSDSFLSLSDTFGLFVFCDDGLVFLFSIKQINVYCIYKSYGLKERNRHLESLGYSLQYSQVSHKIKENEYSDFRGQVKSC